MRTKQFLIGHFLICLRTPLVLPFSIAIALCVGCTNGSHDPGGDPGSELSVMNVSVVPGAVWKINRPIDISFDQPVDFSTVSLNTIQIVNAIGVSATGAFLQPIDASGQTLTKVVRFQPTCPNLEDFSDAGLAIGQEYQLRILGLQSGGNSIALRSATGGALEQGLVVPFRTPDSTLPETLFLDTRPGPPNIRIRGLGNLALEDPDASHFELGGDSDNRFYLGTSDVESFELPLNKYSDPSTRVAFMMHLDQPVLASQANLNSDRVRFEFLEAGNTVWEPIQTEVNLISNCLESGSLIRLEPLGLLPQGSTLRVKLAQGFADITGDATVQDISNFVLIQTASVLDAQGLAIDDSDELLEEFVLSGTHRQSLEDTETALGDPRAAWGLDGKLEASFAFGGTGGPGGQFDYHVPAGQTITINTTTATIIGGPGGDPLFTQVLINGVLDVRNLFVPIDSRLVFVGPNPATILASGSVTIAGSISCNGGNNDGVGTLGTTFQPEPGAAGNAGGGRGGLGSFLTAQSTPRGGSGFGPRQTAGRGGGGGESCYSLGTTDNRRPAGGGGGRLGRDILYDHDIANLGDALRFCQTLIGMDSESGFSGSLNGTGAVSQTAQAQGGVVGRLPFQDMRDDNDFFGTQISAEGQLIIGELNELSAGAGGGAGGDASSTNTFPQIPFQTDGDEKGGGGGGGAGGLSILAIGPIVVENGGFVTADGGHGGGGENTGGTNRVGGAGGGGSGGHIVFSSASYIDIQGIAQGAGEGYRDPGQGHRTRPISALGGQGGAGHDDRGGADSTGPTTWRCDAISLDRVTAQGTGTDVPPLAGASICFGAIGMPDYNSTGGPVFGAGGDGGPGIVQFHVDDPSANLRFSGIGTTETWPTADLTQACAPTPIGWKGEGTAADVMQPLFGRISVAQSEWIPLGLARVSPGADPDDQVRFFFDGTDPATGSVLRSDDGLGNAVAPLIDLIPAAPLGDPGTLPYVEISGLSILFDGSELPQAYHVNPRLLRGFHVVLRDSVREWTTPVLRAEALTSQTIRLTVSANNNLSDGFINTAVGEVQASLRPSFFRMSAGGITDAFPPGTDVQILFDAANFGDDGKPNEASSFSFINGEPTGDATELNGQNWDVFRFRVIFNLNTEGAGVDLTGTKPALEFLRLPFVY